MMFLDSLLFSANVTLPTILMMTLGIVLRRRKLVNDAFCETASKVVFNIALPAMLFINLVKNPMNYTSQMALVSAGILGTLLLYFASEWFAARHIAERAYRGIFVQGVFRSNNGILGIALCINAYGAPASAPASVYTAGLTVIFNVLAVFTLTHSLTQGKLRWANVGKSVITNPLILAITAGFGVNQLGITLPFALLRTGDSLAQMTLPLALICTGASLNFNQLKNVEQGGIARQVVWWAALGRLVICPLLMICIGKGVFDLAPMSLGILFLMSSASVAVASYAMVRHFGGDATAAANLIGVSTIGSIVISSLGSLILHAIGWI